MSAEACLAGLFPPKDYQIWNSFLDWQPIPVHVIPLNQDYLIAGINSCDRYDALYASADQILYNEQMEKFGPLIEYLKENSGGKLNTVANFKSLFDILKQERLRNFRYKNGSNLTNNKFSTSFDIYSACHCGLKI